MGADLSGALDAPNTCESDAVQIAELLSKLADASGEPIAARAFATLLGQGSTSRKLVALRGLKAVLPRPQSATVASSRHYCTAREAVLECLKDPCSNVAAAAATVLEQLCLQGDKVAVHALTALAQKSDCPESLLALASTCQLGDEAALRTFCLRL